MRLSRIIAMTEMPIQRYRRLRVVSIAGSDSVLGPPRQAAKGK